MDRFPPKIEVTPLKLIIPILEVTTTTIEDLSKYKYKNIKNKYNYNIKNNKKVLNNVSCIIKQITKKKKIIKKNKKKYY